MREPFPQETIEMQQKLAQHVLFKIKTTLDPEAVIAGGAPANWLQSQSARDIDLFFRSNIPFSENVIRLFQDLFKDARLVSDSAEIMNYRKFMPGIRRVIRMIIEGVPFDFVQVDSWQGTNFEQFILDVFDCNVCRVSWNGSIRFDHQVPRLADVTYNITDDFVEGIDTQLIFRFDVPVTDGLKFRPSHVLKLAQKFPDHPLSFWEAGKDVVDTRVAFAPQVPAPDDLRGLAHFFPYTDSVPSQLSDHLFVDNGEIKFVDHQQKRQSFTDVLVRSRFFLRDCESALDFDKLQDLSCLPTGQGVA